MDPLSRIRRCLAPRLPLPTRVAPILDPLPDVRAVVFDVYGTLFTSGSGDVGTAAATENPRRLGEALREAGLPEDAARPGDWAAAVQAAHAAARAKGIAHPEIDARAIWRQVVRAPADDAQLDALAVEYECRMNPCWPMPGCASVLAALRGRGLVLGIVSNAQFYTPLLFEACLGASPAALGFALDLCAWSYRLGEAKPSPRLFAPVVAALAQHHVSPRQALYVGNDMLNDIATATQAGLRTCLFAGDRRSLRLRPDDPRCHHLRPNRIITALNQLLPLLELPAPR